MPLIIDLKSLYIFFILTENLFTYTLTKSGGDERFSFICEIKKTELNRIVQEERDFSKIYFVWTQVYALLQYVFNLYREFIVNF